jgi:hypothetical protein
MSYKRLPILAIDPESELGRALHKWANHPWPERKKRPGPKYVYFAISGRMVKIGCSDFPEFRVDALRTANPGINLFGQILGGQKLERSLQKAFLKYKIAGEWFWLTEDIKRTINALLQHAEEREWLDEFLNLDFGVRKEGG